MRKLLVAAVVVLAGALAPPALAVERPGATEQAMAIVNANVGDVPAPNEKGIVNNIDNLPAGAFNSVTRNPVCSDYTGTAP